MLVTAGQPQPPITTLDDVLAWLGSTRPDADICQAAYEAAEAYVGKRARWVIEPVPDDAEYPPAPFDLVQAVRFQTARYLARRNSPDGLVGMGDLGAARIPITDRDVGDLIAPWRRVVFG